MYGAVMGLAGLGLTGRAAAPLFPGLVRAPAYLTEPWVLLGTLLLALLIPAYLVKLLRYPSAVRDDFTRPATFGFCGALPVGMSLVAGGIAPYAPLAGSVLWWIACALLAALQVWAIYRWLCGGIELPQVNAGWLIIFVGGIVVPGPGIGLGHAEASRFFFSVSAAAAPLIMALLFYRAVVAPQLAEALRPSWFVLLVPPSLIYANGAALFGDTPALEGLYFSALVLALGLFAYSWKFWKWPFAPSWWAFTFPLDALAYAAARYAQQHPEPLWRGVAAASLLLAASFVVLVLVRTVRSAASPRA